MLKQLTTTSYRKSSLKLEKPSHSKENIAASPPKEGDKIPISYDELKNVLVVMKKLTNQNSMLKKQLKVLKKAKPSSTIVKALLY